jgi:hypothetical protein
MHADEKTKLSAKPSSDIAKQLCGMLKRLWTRSATLFFLKVPEPHRSKHCFLAIQEVNATSDMAGGFVTWYPQPQGMWECLQLLQSRET